MRQISPQGRSRIMRAVKSKNTTLEVTFRKALFAAGYRYRLHDRRLPGTPDIVFPRRKKIIFVNGCFWHQHKNCKRAKSPRTNKTYWLPKLKRNVQRDRENVLQLKKLGWSILVVWECSLGDFGKAVGRAIRFLDEKI